MKYSIVFPGQGSQSPGMLSDLRSNFPVINEIFQEASDAINLDLWKIINEDHDLLNLTANTQPIMLAAGYATYKVLASEVNLTPISFAGHSLGEYTALVASGSLGFFEAVQLVRKRAELMQAAVPRGLGSMAAILGLDDARVIEICLKASDKGVVEAVNFNSPGQVVIAGEKNAVAHAC
jgi:[acyl-carrier-protein] S-malonyltransferase